MRIRKRIPSVPGFTLIQLCIALMIIAVVAAAVPWGSSKNTDDYKKQVTLDRMQRVEEAMRSFMYVYQARPCPAQPNDIRAVQLHMGLISDAEARFPPGPPSSGGSSSSGGSGSSSSGISGAGPYHFGDEAGDPGGCAGAPFRFTDANGHTVVGGVIPTDALFIPREMAYDAWGNFETYVVDLDGTDPAKCLALGTGNGHIILKSTTAVGGKVLGTSMVAYISHGPDRHGALLPPPTAAPAPTQFNANSVDADTLENASSPSFDNVFVMHPPTPGFDDIVRVYGHADNTDATYSGEHCALTAPPVSSSGTVSSSSSSGSSSSGGSSSSSTSSSSGGNWDCAPMCFKFSSNAGTPPCPKNPGADQSGCFCDSVSMGGNGAGTPAPGVSCMNMFGAWGCCQWVP